MEVIQNMGTIKDEANQYKPAASVANISELASVDANLVVFEAPDAEFPYKYVEINLVKYKVPVSVLATLKEILKSNPNLKTFKVNKSGQGMNTKYVVIPLS
jgi:hypothetical protein